MPSWAEPKPTRRMTGSWGLWPDVVAKNVQSILDLEKITKEYPMDFVLYGDSITAFHAGYVLSKVTGNNRPWKKHFGDLRALALGVAGDQVANVLWRITNREKPKVAPKVIGLLVGVNDLIGWGQIGAYVPSTVKRLKILITTISNMYPSTHIIVFALTPVNGTILRKKRQKHNNAVKKMIAKMTDVNVSFADTAAVITASNGGPIGSDILADGVHLTENGHEKHLREMRRFVSDRIFGYNM